MSKNHNPTAEQVVEAFQNALALLSAFDGGTVPAADDKPAKGKGKTKSKAKAEPEPVEEDDETSDDEDGNDADLSERVAELKKQRITALRKLAKGLGFEEDEVAEADKDELAQAIAEAEAEDAAEGDDDEGEDDDAEDESEDADEAADEEDEEEDDEEDEDGGEDEDEESEEYTRDDYLAMSLPDLKGLAKEAGYKAADLKGLDKDGIADLLLDEESEEDEEEEDALTEEDLREMSLAELKALCKDYGIKVPKGAKQDDLVELLMEEDEDE